MSDVIATLSRGRVSRAWVKYSSYKITDKAFFDEEHFAAELADLHEIIALDKSLALDHCGRPKPSICAPAHRGLATICLKVNKCRNAVE